MATPALLNMSTKRMNNIINKNKSKKTHKNNKNQKYNNKMTDYAIVD